MLKNSKIPPVKNVLSKNLREKLEDAFDVNFSVSEIRIDSMADFVTHLYEPSKSGEKIYYRGERINESSRRLIPTFLRADKPVLKNSQQSFVNLSSRELFDFYCSDKPFIKVYQTLYGEPTVDKMYNMTAFAQHYLDISPFIDFSKSLFVAVSFALKGREEFNDDIVIYTAYDIGDDDTTSNINEVNLWLENYNVNIIKTDRPEDINSFFLERQKRLPELKSHHLDIKRIDEIFKGVLPTAKLIDIPTNDLMKYQQGVFLLLNDFSLVDSQYLTKTVRQSFVINKYIIDKSICPKLNSFLLENAPQYRYECIMNIAKAVKG